MAVLSVATINKHLPLTNKYIYMERGRRRGGVIERRKEGGIDERKGEREYTKLDPLALEES